MTVREMMERLATMDPDAVVAVVLDHDDRGVYGASHAVTRVDPSWTFGHMLVDVTCADDIMDEVDIPCAVHKRPMRECVDTEHG